MTRRFATNGVLPPASADYYRRRAESGLSLIIGEATYVDHVSAGVDPRVPRFHGARALAAWRSVLDAVHGAGGLMFPQLWHVGTEMKGADPAIAHRRALSPSGLTLEGERLGAAMTVEDIAAVIQAFGRSAHVAREMGFDGVEVHGAHGYLTDQFLWRDTNRRRDAYGGDLVARTRFAAELVHEIRQRTAPDFPVSFRISQWKIRHYGERLAESPDELQAILRPLVEAGVTTFHASTRRYWEPEFSGSDLGLAGWIKQLTGLPVIAVGSVGVVKEFTPGSEVSRIGFGASLDPLLERLQRDEFDLVAVGRSVLADPQWAEHVRAGEAVRAYEAHGEHDLY